MKFILIFISLFISLAGMAAVYPMEGEVCLGPYGGFVQDEKSHLYFTIDDSKEKIAFNGAEPRVVAQGLDSQRRHVIRVFYDSTLVQSWAVSFAKRKAIMVDVWRSPGGWHLESNPAGKCQWPRPEK